MSTVNTGPLQASVKIIQATCYQTVPKVVMPVVVEVAVLMRVNIVSTGHLLANVRIIQAICYNTVKRVVTFAEVDSQMNKTNNS